MPKLKYVCKNCSKEFYSFLRAGGKPAVNCSIKCRGERHSIWISRQNRLDPPSRKPGVGEKISKSKMGKPIAKHKFHKDKILSSGGYYLIWSPNHPRVTKHYAYVFEHILIMEKHIDRFLTKDEIIHHINGIKTDNRIENLMMTNPTEHLKLEKSRPDWWGN